MKKVRIYTTQSGSQFTVALAGPELGWLVHYHGSDGALRVFTCDDYSRATEYPLKGRMRFFGQRVVSSPDGLCPSMTSPITSERVIDFATGKAVLA